MLNLIKSVCFYLLLFTTTISLSQIGTSQKGSLSIDIGIPTSERNLAFKHVLEGLFNGGVTYQYNVYKGLTVGVGGKYSFFVNDRFALNQSTGKGGLHIPAGYLKVGYEKFTTDRFSINISARTGFSSMISATDTVKSLIGKAYIENAFFIEPQIELLLTAEKNDPNAFSIMLGYAVYFSEYRPAFLAIDHFVGLDDAASKGFTRFFSLGFGYRYYFGLN